MPQERKQSGPFSLQGLDHVALNVRDLDRSLRFYTEVLGLRISEREFQKPGKEYFLDCGTSLIGLIQADSLCEEDAHPFRDSGLGANHFSFRIKASEFDSILESLRQQQVEIAFAKKRPKSWSLYFYDPDGNKLEMTAWPAEDAAGQ